MRTVELSRMAHFSGRYCWVRIKRARPVEVKKKRPPLSTGASSIRASRCVLRGGGIVTMTHGQPEGSTKPKQSERFYTDCGFRIVHAARHPPVG
jgi:hypothetical protein